MRFVFLVTAMLISGNAVAQEPVYQQEPDYQALYKKAAVDLAQAEAMIGMLKKQTWAFRRLMKLHGITYKDEVVIRNDAGIVVERIDLSENPVPAIAPRLTDRPKVN